MRKSSSLALCAVILTTLILTSAIASAQRSDSLLQVADLPNVINYALKNQPVIQQSLLGEKITEMQVRSRLADWYPQINFNYNYQHNFEVQQTIIGGNLIRLGVGNTSAFQFTASQTIFNRDVLLARRSKSDVEQQAKQQTTSSKIDVVVDVSKAFYAVLAVGEQMKVADATIARLERSLKDAQSQYEAGVVDKTDYKRALIALNNAVATRKAADETMKSRLTYLKSVMNYPGNAHLNIVYDSLAMENAIALDTLQHLDYGKRIEYQLLQTQRRLLETNLRYNKWSYLPSVSANGAYNFNYLNNEFSKLYNQSFPNSYAGLTLSFPIFQGGKRRFNVRAAEYELRSTDLQIVSLENSFNAQYADALAAYKNDLIAFQTIRENVLLAQEVYDVIQLQYRAGIKAYLEVITAETDLRTAQINYFNALYLLLSSKIDVERALGNIQY